MTTVVEGRSYLRSSAVLWACTAGPEAKEDPIRITNARSYLRDPKQQAVSSCLGDHSEDVCPLAGHTCWLCGLPCESAKQLTEHLRETNDDRHRVLGDDKLILPAHIPNQTAAMLIHQGARMIASIEQAGTGVALPAIRGLNALVGGPRGLKQHSRAGPE